VSDIDVTTGIEPGTEAGGGTWCSMPGWRPGMAWLGSRHSGPSTGFTLRAAAIGQE